MPQMSPPNKSSVMEEICVCPTALKTRPGSGRGHKLSVVCHISLRSSEEEAVAPVTLASSQLTQLPHATLCSYIKFMHICSQGFVLP